MRVILGFLCRVVFLATVVMYAGCTVPHQPVAMIYIDDGAAAEQRLRLIARKLATKYKMGTILERTEPKSWETGEFYTFQFFSATKSGWLFRLALTKGSGATFYLMYAQKRVDLSISGPPDHPDVHGLAADWPAALDAAKIPYRMERRTPLQPMRE
jgi:hypothetical protein